jgi:hypothetical protein
MMFNTFKRDCKSVDVRDKVRELKNMGAAHPTNQPTHPLYCTSLVIRVAEWDIVGNKGEFGTRLCVGCSFYFVSMGMEKYFIKGSVLPSLPISSLTSGPFVPSGSGN